MSNRCQRIPAPKIPSLTWDIQKVPCQIYVKELAQTVDEAFEGKDSAPSIGRFDQRVFGLFMAGKRSLPVLC